MSSQDLQGFTSELKRLIYGMGFQRAGITDGIPPFRSNYLREWIRLGYHGSMGYMARDLQRRMDPSRLLSNLRSIISVAINYYAGDRHPLAGKISRYAWGEDYHRVIWGKLSKIANWISTQTGARTMVCVDTSPIMEKLWAQKAGIGWQGKNTLIITKGYGSWIFLGEILVDLELAYDKPFDRDLCGRCTRCIDACPTGAIVRPYVLEARRCISYLTIEHRGPIPQGLKDLMGGRTLGCDLCQEVCPWNRFAKITEEPAFQVR
jgi:epoxyqueuosine reductase